MRNKMKSISLALGALAAVATPTVAVISCGTKAKEHHRPVAFTPVKGKDGGKEAPVNVEVDANYQENNVNGNMIGNGMTTDYDKISKDEAEAGQTFDNFQDYRQDAADKIAKLKQTLLNDTTANPVDVTRAIVERYIGDRVDDFTFKLIAKKSIPTKLPISKNRPTVMENREFNEYTIEVTEDHQVIIEGSSAVAMARGWYDWMKRNGYGMIGWQANSIHLPAKTEFKVTAKFKTSSPYERHYFGNSAAAGYSSPWWNGDNWANWLAWCAVHGYDLMLDYVGHEQILTRLFSEIGFTKDNIRKYLSGPAYATWQRLGNIANWDQIPDNKMFDVWSEKRVAVQKEIKAMMDKMDIKGIPASFAGFVPEVQNGVTESFESKFGEAEPSYDILPNGATYYDAELGRQSNANKDHTSTYTQRTHWTEENQHHNHFLNPDWKPAKKNPLKDAMTADTESTGYDDEASLFQNMSKRYVELYQREFGESDLYLADAFEEMYIPPSYDKPSYFKKVGNALYGGIEAATINNTNGSAVFAFQGWNLGFQRGDWNPDSLEGFLEDIPNNKVFIIDQAEDYNEWSWHNNANFRYFKKDSFGGGQSFGGKKWTYCTIPNMGGNTAITGNLEWYGTAGPDALNEDKHGYLYAYGSAPEGIDTNPVTQELIADMGWRTEAIDIKNGTLEGYVGNNWLANYDINRYGFESKGLREYWLRRLATANSYLDDHPIHKWQLAGWSTWSAPDSDGWLMALKAFKDVAKERQGLKNTPLFRDDLFRFTNVYLGVILDRKLTDFQSTSDKAEKAKIKAEIDVIFDTMNRLTATHNTDRLSRWLEMAKWYGDEEKAPGSTAYFEQDAKYHLTLWYPSLEDYASKHWGGMIHYYQLKMDTLMDRDLQGTGESQAESQVQLHANWVNGGATLPKVSLPWIYNQLTGTDLNPQPYDQPYAEAIKAMEANSIVSQNGIAADAYATLVSNPYQDNLKDIKTEFQVTTEQLQNLESLTIFSKVVYDDGKYGNPGIKDIKIIAGTGEIWRHRYVGAALNNTPGNAEALTINLEGLDRQIASDSNNGAKVVITWAASKHTNAKLQLFMNADIDPTDPDKSINGAKTYREFNDGKELENEVVFLNGRPQPEVAKPTISIEESARGTLINRDATVNNEAAAAMHVTVVPYAVPEKKDENGWALFTYKVTVDDGYELGESGIATPMLGSGTVGTFQAAKPWNSWAIPTVEQLIAGHISTAAAVVSNQITVTEEDRNHLINADGTIDEHEADDLHITLVPAAVRPQDEAGYARFTYTITAQEGYTLAGNDVITLNRGSSTEGVLIADKIIEGEVATLQHLVEVHNAATTANHMQHSVNYLVGKLNEQIKVLQNQHDQEVIKVYMAQKAKIQQFLADHPNDFTQESVVGPFVSPLTIAVAHSNANSLAEEMMSYFELLLNSHVGNEHQTEAQAIIDEAKAAFAKTTSIRGVQFLSVGDEGFLTKLQNLYGMSAAEKAAAGSAFRQIKLMVREFWKVTDKQDEEAVKAYNSAKAAITSFLVAHKTATHPEIMTGTNAEVKAFETKVAELVASQAAKALSPARAAAKKAVLAAYTAAGHTEAFLIVMRTLNPELASAETLEDINAIKAKYMAKATEAQTVVEHGLPE